MVRSIGQWVVGFLEGAGRLLYTLVGTGAAAVRSHGQGRGVVGRVTLMQVLFTGFEALPLVSVIALVVGATFIVQLTAALPELAGQLGRVLVVLVIREIGPMATAVVVAGRSGTAIATELGNMQVNNEVKALRSMGINPLHYLVLPRFVGVVVAVLCLLAYFDLVAILGGYLASLALLGPEREVLLDSLVAALEPADVVLLLVKGLGSGLAVAWLCCHYGLEVQVSPTEVPQKASRAVVASLLACLVFNSAVSTVYYLAVA